MKINETEMLMEAVHGRATSTGEGSITIEGKHIDGFRRWYQQLQAQYDVPVKIKPRSKRGQRKRIWGHK